MAWCGLLVLSGDGVILDLTPLENLPHIFSSFSKMAQRLQLPVLELRAVGIELVNLIEAGVHGVRLDGVNRPAHPQMLLSWLLLRLRGRLLLWLLLMAWKVRCPWIRRGSWTRRRCRDGTSHLSMIGKATCSSLDSSRISNSLSSSGHPWIRHVRRVLRSKSRDLELNLLDAGHRGAREVVELLDLRILGA